MGGMSGGREEGDFFNIKRKQDKGRIVRQQGRRREAGGKKSNIHRLAACKTRGSDFRPTIFSYLEIVFSLSSSLPSFLSWRWESAVHKPPSVWAGCGCDRRTLC
jgi:hypothetical protein